MIPSHPALMQPEHIRRYRFSRLLYSPEEHESSLMNLLYYPFLKLSCSHPSRIAVLCGSSSLTYRELLSKSLQIACLLRHRHQVKPQELVAITMQKGMEMIIGVLAIQLAGAAYCPIDPVIPSLRKQELYALTKCRIILTQTSVDHGARRHSAVDFHSNSSMSESSISSGLHER